MLLTPVRSAAQPAADLMNLRRGAAVTVWLHSGERLKGKLGDVGVDAFEMQVARKDRIEDKLIPIADMRKIRVQGHVGPGRRAAGTLAAATITSVAIAAPIALLPLLMRPRLR